MQISRTVLIVGIVMTCLLTARRAISAQSDRNADLSGDWQATLKGTVPGRDFRLVLRVARTDAHAAWTATLFSIDQGPTGREGTAASMAQRGLEVQFAAPDFDATYSGAVGENGVRIHGTWTGAGAIPLDWERATPATGWSFKIPQHQSRRVGVEKATSLEVLDYGGTGRPMVFLAGLGATAHVFDEFAMRFTASHHVYGVTRRGFGNSSAPVPTDANYSADRLGADVLAVMDSLKIDRAVLVGHSIAGEELSSIGSRHPERVAGLVYLDAGFPYAFYDASRGDMVVDAIHIKAALEELILGKFGGAHEDPDTLVQRLLEVELPRLTRDLRRYKEELVATYDPKDVQRPDRLAPIARAILEGQRRHTTIPVPILAIYASPSNWGNAYMDDSIARQRYTAWDSTRKATISDSFERGLPTARVVRLPHADHFVIASHEAEVLREMNSFLAGLP
ncbi:MAG: alpha/beta hydrolase [bacterium]